jgi:hypothetical protein
MFIVLGLSLDMKIDHLISLLNEKTKTDLNLLIVPFFDSDNVTIYIPKYDNGTFRSIIRPVAGEIYILDKVDNNVIDKMGQLKDMNIRYSILGGTYSETINEIHGMHIELSQKIMNQIFQEEERLGQLKNIDIGPVLSIFNEIRVIEFFKRYDNNEKIAHLESKIQKKMKENVTVIELDKDTYVTIEYLLNIPKILRDGADNKIRELKAELDKLLRL